jgi:hypothetical protein
MPYSSGFARSGSVTLRVLGGKNGKKRQETATNGKVSGKNGNARWVRGRVHAVRHRVANAQERAVCVCMRLFKVPAAQNGIAMIELIYHTQRGMSRAREGGGHGE